MHTSVLKIRHVGMPFWVAKQNAVKKCENVGMLSQRTWGQHSNVHYAKVRMVQTPFPYGHWATVLWDMWRVDVLERVGHDVTGVNGSILWKHVLWKGWEGYEKMFLRMIRHDHEDGEEGWVIPCRWVWLNRVQFFLGIWRDPRWSFPTISSPIWWDHGIWMPAVWEKILYVLFF